MTEVWHLCLCAAVSLYCAMADVFSCVACAVLSLSGDQFMATGPMCCVVTRVVTCDTIESSCSRSVQRAAHPTILGRNAQDRDWVIGSVGFPTGET